jgi:hypothetical protein
MYRAQKALASVGARTQYVYFMLAEMDPDEVSGIQLEPMVKIGISVDPYQRREQVAIDPGKCGDWLEVFGCDSLTVIGMLEGGREAEKALHAAFKEHRIAGEWFWYDPLSEAIDGLLCDHCVCPSCQFLDAWSVSDD